MNIVEQIELLMKVGAAAMMNDPPYPVANLQQVIRSFKPDEFEAYLAATPDAIMYHDVVIRGLDELTSRYFADYTPEKLMATMEDIYYGMPRKTRVAKPSGQPKPPPPPGPISPTAGTDVPVPVPAVAVVGRNADDADDADRGELSADVQLVAGPAPIAPPIELTPRQLFFQQPRDEAHFGAATFDDDGDFGEHLLEPLPQLPAIAAVDAIERASDVAVATIGPAAAAADVVRPEPSSSAPIAAVVVDAAIPSPPNAAVNDAAALPPPPPPLPVAPRRRPYKAPRPAPDDPDYRPPRLAALPTAPQMDQNLLNEIHLELAERALNKRTAENAVDGGASATGAAAAADVVVAVDDDEIHPEQTVVAAADASVVVAADVHRSPDVVVAATPFVVTADVHRPPDDVVAAEPSPPQPPAAATAVVVDAPAPQIIVSDEHGLLLPYPDAEPSLLRAGPDDISLSMQPPSMLANQGVAAGDRHHLSGQSPMMSRPILAAAIPLHSSTPNPPPLPVMPLLMAPPPTPLSAGDRQPRHYNLAARAETGAAVVRTEEITLNVPVAPMRLLFGGGGGGGGGDDETAAADELRPIARRLVGALRAADVPLLAGPQLSSVTTRQAVDDADDDANVDISAPRAFETICMLHDKGVLTVLTDDATGTFAAVSLD